MSAISRMQFLRGDFHGSHETLRPPWALTEIQFITRCNACGECVRHCPSAILTTGRGGYPLLDFTRGGCDFCGECVRRCSPGALQAESMDRSLSPWALKAVIGERCITRQGVICRTCGEQCETRAITFRLSAGRVPPPELNTEHCTGCGACYAPCPVKAITLRPTGQVHESYEAAAL